MALTDDSYMDALTPKELDVVERAMRGGEAAGRDAAALCLANAGLLKERDYLRSEQMRLGTELSAVRRELAIARGIIDRAQPAQPRETESG